MSEWGIALIAAGSAILGSSVTGFFAWKAGHRQAAAAEAAGQAQAAALISTVQATLDEQRRARADERRRQAYAALLTAASDYEVNEEAADGARMIAALNAIQVEGPTEVTRPAFLYASLVSRSVRQSTETIDTVPARSVYLEAVHRALNET